MVPVALSKIGFPLIYIIENSLSQLTVLSFLLKPLVLAVPQGSVLGPLLFLIYINDLNFLVKNSTVHHFADETNLLYINKSLKLLCKNVNYDLKGITHWLNANRISLNVNKTEFVIFSEPKEAYRF